MVEYLDRKPPKPVVPVKKSIPVAMFFSQEPAASDIQCEYGRDIFSTYYENEFSFAPGFLNKQAEFTFKHRAILIDWMHSTHKRFKLSVDTLFLALSILDRYLSIKSIRVTQMQLLGVSCLFVASKYEEIYPPDLNELLGTTDNVFLKDQAVLLERDILCCLDFSILKPNPLKFFYRFCEIFDISGNLYSFGLYLLELAFDYKLVMYKPSVIAASCVLITHILFHKEISCRVKSNLLIDAESKPCINELLKVLETARENPLNSVWETFSKRKYHCVSSLTLI